MASRIFITYWNYLLIMNYPVINSCQYTFEIMLYKNVDIKEIFYDNNVAFSNSWDSVYNFIIELNTSPNRFIISS